jgi:hypothetical protein
MGQVQQLDESTKQPWYLVNPARLIKEKKMMENRFPHFQLVRDGVHLVWIGTIDSIRGNHYEIALYYPNDFPEQPPKVYPINPPISSWEDREAGRLKHQWNDGSLCLDYPSDKTFNLNATAATVIAMASAWFFAYETWIESNQTEWPGVEAPRDEWAH